MGSCSIFFVAVISSLVVFGFIAWMASVQESAKLEKMSPDERTEYLEAKRERAKQAQARMRDIQQGQVSTAMICPHCQARGTVRTKRVTQKKGVSGGKATAAVLTGGVSLLATGLSRKEAMTEAHCDKCGSTWHF